MPRRGKGTQPAASGPTQVYGQGQELTNAMKAIPLPDNTVVPTSSAEAALAPSPTSPTTPIRGGGGAVDASNPYQAAIDAQPSAVSGAIDAHMGYDRPMTDGLPLGPGAPGVTMPGQDNFFMTVYRRTGDPYFLKLAQRARQQ